MGNNNFAGFLRLSESLRFPSQIHLETNATINTAQICISNKSYNGGYVQIAEVFYTVGGSKCNLSLKRTVCNDGNVNSLSFELRYSVICTDQKELSFLIFKDGSDLINVNLFDPDKYSNAWTKTRKNVDARGGVTDTKVCLYGTANRCGLLVLECKKNDSHEAAAKTLTIAHYFVSSNGTVAVNRFFETTDIGFSVVANIGLSDGEFDITVEGPEPHPVFALLHMFNEVNRSGIWKPSIIVVTFGGIIAECFCSLTVKTMLFLSHHVLVTNEMQRPLPTMEGSEDMLMVVPSDAEISMVLIE